MAGDIAKMRTEKDLLAEVNRSGFPLQIAVERATGSAPGTHHWRTRYVEHRWENARTKTGGFIDLVLEHQSGRTHLVIECKRVRATDWIFLRNREAENTRDIRARQLDMTARAARSGWQEVDYVPPSPESKFCVGIGEDPASPRPMLERIAGGLVESVDALVSEDESLRLAESGIVRTYIGVIVTTAILRVCGYDSSDVDLVTGELKDADFATVGCVRFRKQLADIALPSSAAADFPRAKESTVIVVNATQFGEFLRRLDPML
jgi:hypothetical protein